MTTGSRWKAVALTWKRPLAVELAGALLLAKAASAIAAAGAPALTYAATGSEGTGKHSGGQTQAEM